MHLAGWLPMRSPGPRPPQQGCNVDSKCWSSNGEWRHAMQRVPFHFQVPRQHQQITQPQPTALPHPDAHLPQRLPLPAFSPLPQDPQDYPHRVAPWASPAASPTSPTHCPIPATSPTHCPMPHRLPHPLPYQPAGAFSATNVNVMSWLREVRRRWHVQHRVVLHGAVWRMPYHCTCPPSRTMQQALTPALLPRLLHRCAGPSQGSAGAVALRCCGAVSGALSGGCVLALEHSGSRLTCSAPPCLLASLPRLLHPASLSCFAFLPFL